MKVLVFGASLRKGSINKKLAAAAAEALRKKGAEPDLADFREFEMPVYDGDLEDSSGVPAGAKALGKRIADAGALVISSPEYNGSIPGPLKNAIDWLSRLKPVPLGGKPTLLLTASPGAFGGVRGAWATRVPLEVLSAQVFADMFHQPGAYEAFDEKGAFKDAKQAARLEKLVAAFVDFAKKLGSQ